MKEAVVYINSDQHTGHIKDAARELTDRCGEVVERCLLGINQVDPIYVVPHIPFRLKIAVRLPELRQSEKEKWLKSEDVVGSILRQIGINYKPLTIMLKLAEHLDQVPQLLTYQDARGYFGYTKRRLLHLDDQETQRKLGTIRHAAYSLVESVVLKRAVFEGVYLTQG